MNSLFCDVSLPVPIDRPFTYSPPETLRHRVRPGCRVLVPFGTRKLTGVVLRTHNDRPREADSRRKRLLDEEPALDEALSETRRAGSYRIIALLSAKLCEP